jgi:hypothetical protein
MVILLDDVEGRGRRQYKWNFQAAGLVRLSDRRVEIRNGRAAASVVFCNLDRRRGYRMTEETRASYYTSHVDDHAGEPITVRSFSVSNLHRETQSLLGAVVFAGDAECVLSGCDVGFSAEPGKPVQFVCTSKAARAAVTVDLASRAIKVERTGDGPSC